MFVAVPGWLQFEFVRNPGAVFGIAPGQTVGVPDRVGRGHRVPDLPVRRQRPAVAVYQVVLGVLLAGVLGNMYDRVAFGSVRDMIHALPGWRWPAGVHRALPFLPADVFPYIFNVADSLLCVGVGVMLVYSFVATPPAPASPAVVAPADAPTP